MKTFDYVRDRVDGLPKKDWPKRASLPVTLFHGDRRQNMYCLVDSGADDCLFHSRIGKLLGIDVSSGNPKTFGGIAGGLVARMHVIQLQVQGLPQRVTIVAGFTDSDGVGGILGQSGFLENFQVIFERYRWKFHVGFRPQPIRL